MRRGNSDTIYFMISGILLAAIIMTVFLIKINELMNNKDLFDEYHTDEITSLTEALTTTPDYSQVPYGLNNFNFCEIRFTKLSSDNNFYVSMGTSGTIKKAIQVPKDYQLNVGEGFTGSTGDAELVSTDNKCAYSGYDGILLTNDGSSITVSTMKSCDVSSPPDIGNSEVISAYESKYDIGGNKVLFYNPQGKDIKKSGVLMQVIAGGENVKCDIISALRKKYSTAIVVGTQYSASQNVGLPDGYDAYVIIK